MPHALYVGADDAALESLRQTGAEVEVVATTAEAVAHCRDGARVDLVVGDAAALRAALDPLGTGAGPAIAAPGTGRELALELAVVQARAQAAARERALALQALDHAAAVDAADEELVRRLAAAAVLRDDNTEEHIARVGATAARIAVALGVDAAVTTRLRTAAQLHDLGKISVPDEILLKPDRLSPEELSVVRAHAAIGARLLAGSRSPLIALAAEVARSHHERWDGGGYPDGLAGDAIPLAGRIVAVADAYDVLTHERPWKQERTPAQARAELERGAGTQFDPAVVAAFARA